MTDHSTSADLVRLLCLRSPDQRYRFTFVAGTPPQLVITRLNGKEASPVTGPAPGQLTGAVLVDPGFRLMFCSPADPTHLLSLIAAWTRATAPRVPAVMALVNASAALWKGNPADSKAISEIDPEALSVHRDEALWSGIPTPSVDKIAAVLGGVLPGERLWYWLTDRPGQIGLPLLLVPVMTDPHRDGINAMIEAADPGSGPAATGVAYTTEDGPIQFVGDRLHAAMLETLATWVREYAPLHPDLRRLVRCRLLHATSGRVGAVIADEGVWRGMSRPAVPATAAETEERLAGLQSGETCWFWLTATATDGVFLTVAPQSADPEARSFGARVEGLYRRFPGAFQDATLGVLRRRGDSLEFATAQQRLGDWPAVRRRLAEQHKAAAAALTDATLIITQSPDGIA